MTKKTPLTDVAAGFTLLLGSAAALATALLPDIAEIGSGGEWTTASDDRRITDFIAQGVFVGSIVIASALVIWPRRPAIGLTRKRDAGLSALWHSIQRS